MRRVLALAGALVAVGLATLLLLLVVDIRRYERALVDDDSVFRVDPERGDLWKPSQLLPFAPARRLLGVDDQIEYRRAVRLFALSRPRVNIFEATPEMQRYRGEAAVELWRVAQSDPWSLSRSRALNMLGILDLISVGSDEPVQRMRALVRATASFRRAITADERNADAKFNLEVALRLIDRVKTNNPTLRGLGGAATHTDESGTGY
jgi:hypothetical protein